MATSARPLVSDARAYLVATGPDWCPHYLAVIDDHFAFTPDDGAALRLSQWEDAMSIIRTLPNDILCEYRAEEYWYKS